MIKPPLLTFYSALVIFAAAAPAYADGVVSPAVPHSVQGIAEREIARRADQVARAQQAIAEGDKAMGAKDYEVAVQQYKAAADVLTDSPVTHKLRAAAVDRYCIASVKLAEQQIAEGNFAQAEATAKAVLAPNYNPRCSDALALLSHLEEPGYYNKTITPKFHAKIEQVKDLFVEAQGFFDSAQYEKAMQRYDQILAIDPTNAAAREGQIKVDEKRTEYANTAYEETRARQLWKVAKGWEQPVRKYGPKGGTVISAPSASSNTAAIQNKLNSIIIPKVEFKDATVREAIDFLKTKSRDLDHDPDPSRRGVNIVLQLEAPGGAAMGAPSPAAPADAGAAAAIPGLDPAAAGAAPAAGGAAPAAGGAAPAAAAATPSINPSDARITLSLNNVPMAEVLRYITTLAGLKVKIDPYAVSVVPLTMIVETLITKEYKVPPGTFTGPSGAAGTTTAPAPAVAPTAGAMAPSGSMASRVSAHDYFANLGVQFPPGSAANFIPTSCRLIVKNTQEQLDLIDTLVEALNGAVPSQVDIEAKFVEITQTNLKELSFDWNFASFKIPNTSTLVGGGNSVIAADASGNPIPNTPASLTSGLRSGAGSSTSNAISANAIDSLLFPTANSAAPSIASATGVFDNARFQVVMRALNQKKGVDLLSSPRVTCKSGQEAEIEIVREFKYATEYNPPQIPTSGSGATIMVVTPTTPTAFDVKQVGVRLHVQPTVGADGSTIDLQLEPQVVEFEGFINYGSPIYGVLGGFAGDFQAFVALLTSGLPRGLMTDNVINQPIFSTRKVRTSVSVWDGQTVMLGGLMREDVQKVEDKVPFLGDIPLVGRLFRSSVDQHQKRNLVIFVTARLINPAGDPINTSDEEKDDAPDADLPGTPSLDAAPVLTPTMPLK